MTPAFFRHTRDGGYLAPNRMRKKSVYLFQIWSIIGAA